MDVSAVTGLHLSLVTAGGRALLAAFWHCGTGALPESPRPCLSCLHPRLPAPLPLLHPGTGGVSQPGEGSG